MSQNYVVFKNTQTSENGYTDQVELVIGSFDHETLSALSDFSDELQPVSAGTVSFKPGILGTVQADVTHGSLLLNFPVNLEQMERDKKLIEDNFL